MDNLTIYVKKSHLFTKIKKAPTVEERPTSSQIFYKGALLCIIKV